VIEKFMTDPAGEMLSLHLIADGHGIHGQQVSKEISDKFPEILKNLLSKGYESIA
jgi:hypothetical protein